MRLLPRVRSKGFLWNTEVLFIFQIQKWRQNPASNSKSFIPQPLLILGFPTPWLVSKGVYRPLDHRPNDVRPKQLPHAPLAQALATNRLHSV